MIEYDIICLAQNLFNLLKKPLLSTLLIQCTMDLLHFYLHCKCNSVKNVVADHVPIFTVEVTMFYNQERAQKQTVSSIIGEDALIKEGNPPFSFHHHMQ